MGLPILQVSGRVQGLNLQGFSRVHGDEIKVNIPPGSNVLLVGELVGGLLFLPLNLAMHLPTLEGFSHLECNGVSSQKLIKPAFSLCLCFFQDHYTNYLHFCHLGQGFNSQQCVGTVTPWGSLEAACCGVFGRGGLGGKLSQYSSSPLSNFFSHFSSKASICRRTADNKALS